MIKYDVLFTFKISFVQLCSISLNMLTPPMPTFNISRRLEIAYAEKVTVYKVTWK